MLAAELSLVPCWLDATDLDCMDRNHRHTHFIFQPTRQPRVVPNKRTEFQNGVGLVPLHAAAARPVVVVDRVVVQDFQQKSFGPDVVNGPCLPNPSEM